MSNFTREQLHEYFADSYQPEQVNRALQILAEDKEYPNFDPTGDEFSPDITSELEEIFNAVGVALDNQQKLGQSQELTVVEAGAIAAKYSQHSNPKIVAAMIRMVVEEGIDIGSSLSRIKNKAVEETLKKGDLELAKSLFERNTGTSGFIQQLAGNDQRIDKMLSGYGIGNDAIDVDAFLVEVRGNSEVVKQSVKAIAPAAKQTFDIDAFLLEAGRD